MREIESNLRSFFRRGDAGLVAVYLFGSVARETDRPDSDVDLGLLFEDRPASTLAAQPLRLEGELEQRLGRSVQLVVLNTAPPDLIARVLRDGILILDADRSRRIRFEVDSRNLYFDMLPVLRRYRRSGAA